MRWDGQELTDTVDEIETVDTEEPEKGSSIQPETDPGKLARAVNIRIRKSSHEVKYRIVEQSLDDSHWDLENDLGKERGAGAIEARGTFSLHESTLKRKGGDEGTKDTGKISNRSLPCPSEMGLA